LEIGIPFEDIGAGAKEAIRLILSIERGENEIEKWPLQGYLLITAPDEGYEARFW